jgi:hypothetical protein
MGRGRNWLAACCGCPLRRRLVVLVPRAAAASCAGERFFGAIKANDLRNTGRCARFVGRGTHATRGALAHALGAQRRERRKHAARDSKPRTAGRRDYAREREGSRRWATERRSRAGERARDRAFARAGAPRTCCAALADPRDTTNEGTVIRERKVGLRFPTLAEYVF